MYFTMLASKKINFHRYQRHRWFGDMDIQMEEYYPIAIAARYLGTSRMSIYRYLRLSVNPLIAERPNGSYRLLIKGKNLISFRNSGLPKIGRRRGGNVKK